MSKNYRPGSLLYVNERDERIIAEPGDPMYSTVTMFATHHWTGKEWESIINEENDDAAIS